MNLPRVGLGAHNKRRPFSHRMIHAPAGGVSLEAALMEHLPLVLLAFLYLLTKKVRSFKVQIDFKDDGPTLPEPERRQELTSTNEEAARLSNGKRRRRRDSTGDEDES